jgi:cytochrome o ubiquinol oxidase subunit 1
MSSPPPAYNLAVIPQVTTRDAFFEIKRHGGMAAKYEDIHMPRNTAAGIYISVFAFFVGFAFVWHITWLVVAGIVGIIVCFIARTFNDDLEYTLTAAEVEKIEKSRIKDAQDESSKGRADDEDMGLWEFIKIVVVWALGLVGIKRRSHGN